MARLIVDQALQHANSYAEDGDIELARTLYQKVLDRSPKNEKAHKGLTGLQFRSTDVPEDHLQEAIKQLSNLFDQGHFVSAAEQSLMLTKQYPNNYIFWSIFGFANKMLGRNYASEFGFRNAVRLNPNYPEGYVNIGIALKNQGKLERQ